MTSSGKVEAIHIASAAEAPMTALERVQAVAGIGLEGDRYAARSGTWSPDPPADPPADPGTRSPSGQAFGPPAMGDWRLVPARANRQPAAASYLRRPGDSVHRAFKLDVMRIEDGLIAGSAASLAPKTSSSRSSIARSAAPSQRPP